MSEHRFFDPKRKGNVRKVILQNTVGLVGKAPTKAKRIKMKFLMPISGQKMTGIPEWLLGAYEFICKSHDTVTPQIEFSGFDVTFSAEHLFGEKIVKANKVQLRGFVIAEYGDGENPDVGLTFLAYVPFTDSLWRWGGQMLGEDFYAKFEQVVDNDAEEDSDQLELSDEGDVDDDSEETVVQ